MVSQQDLIQDYQQVAQQLQKQPTLDEYNDHGEHSSYSVYNEFESFDALKEQAGFESGKYSIPSEDLIEDIQRVAEKVGRAPPVEVYQEHGEYNFKTPKRRWGSWHDVLEQCGFEPTEHSEHWKDCDYREVMDSHEKVEIVCEYCGCTDQKREREVKRTDKDFCSTACKGKFMSEQTGKDARTWKEKVEIECERCGEIKPVWPSKADRTRFCGPECERDWRSEHYQGENNPHWVDENVQLYYGKDFPEQREKALERDNHECAVCGRSQKENIRLFDCGLNMHHIRKFKTYAESSEANKLENLIPLCQQCHQFVENGDIGAPTAQWHRQKWEQHFDGIVKPYGFHNY